MFRVLTLIAMVTAPVLVVAGCTSGPGESSTQSESPSEQLDIVRMITHESFALSEETLDTLADLGIDLRITAASDAGSMTAAAVLAAGSPTADVIFGVDNTLVTRAADEGVFAPYTSGELENVRPELATDTANGLVTPISFGDVCINIDNAWFDSNGVIAPTTLEQLPELADLLVVQDPGTSSPGLAFLLATVDRFGDEWPSFWEKLREGGVRVAGSWTDAFYTDFTLSGGDRPLVVSYATSPAAEIIYAEDASVTEPVTSSMTDSCYRQVEYAGVLAGAENPEGAQRVIDWMLSETVQGDIPMSMFVYPARNDTSLPAAFAEFTPIVSSSASLPPEFVSAELPAILATWGEVMGR